MTLALASRPQAQAATAAPFLKWAGGKRQLLPQIRRFYPREFSHYVEAFLGSGAVFFDLMSSDLLRRKRVLLLDSNPDLIACYAAVRDEIDDVVRSLRELEAGHKKHGTDFFYEVRDVRFNPARRSMAKGAGGVPGAQVAAMLIYLNRTCFNGLYRLNSRGDFNTPAGRYANPTICDEANLRNVSAVLRTPEIELRLGDFTQVQQEAGPATFAYFDPPYAPTSKTANFRSYTATGFSEDQQRHLRDLVVSLARGGSSVLLSNSVVPFTTQLYETSRLPRRAGLRAFRVPARRAINCDGTSRGVVDEYLVSNVKPLDADGRER